MFSDVFRGYRNEKWNIGLKRVTIFAIYTGNDLFVPVWRDKQLCGKFHRGKTDTNLC